MIVPAATPINKEGELDRPQRKPQPPRQQLPLAETLTAASAAAARVDGASSAGDFCQETFFEAGDPPGRWRFTLRRDDTAVQTIDVDVYRP
jgi:hypothetical protein